MALYFCILATIFLRHIHSHSDYCSVEDITFEHTPTPLKLTLANLKKLGEGGYGAAYLDEDTNTVYKKNKNDDDTTKEYIITSFFSNEKNIIQTKDLFLTQPGNQLVIGLENCSSGAIADNKISTETNLLNFYSAMRSAFITLNKKCVAHSDFHLQNVLICNGQYKLADFGEAVRTTKDNKTLAQDVKNLGLMLFEMCVNDTKKWGDLSQKMNDENISGSIHEGCKHEELNKILEGLLHIDETERLKFFQIEHGNGENENKHEDEGPLNQPEGEGPLNQPEHQNIFDKKDDDGFFSYLIFAIVIFSVSGIFVIGVLIYYFFKRNQLKKDEMQGEYVVSSIFPSGKDQKIEILT